jgi:hypothetical protein
MGRYGVQRKGRYCRCCSLRRRCHCCFLLSCCRCCLHCSAAPGACKRLECISGDIPVALAPRRCRLSSGACVQLHPDTDLSMLGGNRLAAVHTGCKSNPDACKVMKTQSNGSKRKRFLSSGQLGVGCAPCLTRAVWLIKHHKQFFL